MSRFNQSGSALKIKKLKETVVPNRAGGNAYKTSDKYQLVSLLLTSFLTNQHYRSGDEAIKELKDLINKIDDKEFVAKAAIFARDEFNMRSVSHVAAGELIANGEGIPKIRRFFDKIVVRPDDMLEIITYYAKNYPQTREVDGKEKIKLPFRVKAGFRNAFNKFDDYQIAKYQRKNSEFSLIDLVNLVGPIPTERNKKSLKSLVEGKLKASGTFESELSAAGQSENAEEAKKEAWSGLVTTGKIGYMALVKNLRNILETKDTETIDAACKLLVDQNRAKNSRMLPFRLLSAYFELEPFGTSKSGRQVLSALSDALELLLDNTPELSGDTLVVIDDSGSMTWTPMANSSNTMVMDMAAAFGVSIAKKNNADIVLFSDDARWFNYRLSDPAMTIVSKLRKETSGGGTNMSAAFDLATNSNKKYDRVIVISDMQSWRDGTYNGYGRKPNSGFDNYKKTLGITPFVYSIDMCGYGTLQFKEDKVALLAGFSDKVFDIMTMCETDKNALINKIDAIEI